MGSFVQWHETSGDYQWWQAIGGSVGRFLDKACIKIQDEREFMETLHSCPSGVSKDNLLSPAREGDEHPDHNKPPHPSNFSTIHPLHFANFPSEQNYLKFFKR
ncbi:hypothetical protein SO802_013849 [Lithocarpus litseifolius]|uniref:Uncharacterized protein n=1 Tax=Lithocarpus litseifolius TaxID=425828 RepID=A0AAW2D6R0_9ROSI